MGMKSMAMTEGEMNECMPTAINGLEKKEEGPRYPYGLQIHLDEKCLQKLDVSEMPKVGSTMVITARVEVCSTSEYESQHGGVNRSLGLQITDMDLGSKKKQINISKLYDKDGDLKSKSYNMIDQPDPEKIDVKK